MPPSTTNDSAGERRPRGVRRWLRFSLRGSLLLLAVVSLALWFGWNWPFEEQVLITSGPGPPPAHLDEWREFERGGTILNPFLIADVTGDRYFRRELRTVRRKGFRGTLHHGPTLVFTQGGQKIFEENWRDGRRDGPYRMWNVAGRLLVSGQFRRGRKHGAWTVRHPDGSTFEERAYADGKPHGLWVEYAAPPAGRKLHETRYREGEIVETKWYEYPGSPPAARTWTVAYRDGLPVRLNGQPVREFTQRFADAPDWFQKAIDERMLPVQRYVTLGGFAGALQDAEFPRSFVCTRISASISVRALVKPPHDLISFQINETALKRAGFDIGQRFSTPAADLSLRAAMLIELRALGLVCDYRIDKVVITTREEAERWTDRTGVPELQPPAGSPWARRLEQKTKVEWLHISAFANKTVADQDGAIVRLDPRLDDGAWPRLAPWTQHDEAQPFRYWLHRLLGRKGLTCELKGDTLLIKPQED